MTWLPEKLQRHTMQTIQPHYFLAACFGVPIFNQIKWM